ncbi:YcnI family protein [Archangium violaceum]|uniref:YcnI family copper-binding membrane protein n=1 Tax=Archangium violaceum TaxID=83451 RepID=UPI0019505F1D|nr:YcnI family protein [Archangium violaceum]QRN95979.1 YcnI family protein [Archangium violaceum]
MKALSSPLLAVAVVLLCQAAHAHISVVSGPAFAGKSQELTFKVGHGCNGADTYRVEIRIPEGVTSVRPLDSVFGKAVVAKDAAGKVTSVTWTKAAADVLPGDTQLYKFTLSASLPNVPFTPLFFPTIQSCRAADGTESTTEWVGTTTEHNHGEDAGTTPTAEPAPSVFLYPARLPGWNKYTVDQHVHDLSVFNDAQIVWSGNAAYSPNPATLQLIEKEPNTQTLRELHPGTEIWVKY